MELRNIGLWYGVTTSSSTLGRCLGSLDCSAFLYSFSCSGCRSNIYILVDISGSAHSGTLHPLSEFERMYRLYRGSDPYSTCRDLEALDGAMDPSVQSQSISHAQVGSQRTSLIWGKRRRTWRRSYGTRTGLPYAEALFFPLYPFFSSSYYHILDLRRQSRRTRTWLPHLKRPG